MPSDVGKTPQELPPDRHAAGAARAQEGQTPQRHEEAPDKGDPAAQCDRLGMALPVIGMIQKGDPS